MEGRADRQFYAALESAFGGDGNRAVDGGLFLSTPTVLLGSDGTGVGGSSVTLSALVNTFGAVNDLITVQKLA